MTHDQLQAAAFQWAHNTFPIIRGTLFAVQNEVPPHPGESKQNHIKRISHYKSIGLLSGALDLMLICPPYDCRYTTGYEEDGQWVSYEHGEYVAPAPYGFDAKVGKDSLSEKQQKFIENLRRCGGDGWGFRSFEQFQLILLPIIRKHYGTDPETIEILRRIS